VLASSRLKRDLKHAPDHVLKGLERALDEMSHDPVTPRPGFDCKRLSGVVATFRLRLGTWRVLYAVDMGRRTVMVTTAAPRSAAYR